MSLPRKKRIDEGITSDILKACFCVIGEELTRLINDLLSKVYVRRDGGYIHNNTDS